jgi:mannose-1-phosphate guanylyltransferase
MIGEERLAIILAGEESEDLRSLTRQITGEDTPGQFCAILGETTMLEETWRRVALTFPSERTLTVVTRRHRGFYKRLLSGTQPKRIIVQPHSRGMAPAILYALLRLQDISGNATLAIFPSHHYVEDDAAFMRHVEFALEGARARPDLVVLLGAMPDGPETDYCWIEMGDRVPEYFAFGLCPSIVRTAFPSGGRSTVATRLVMEQLSYRGTDPRSAVVDERGLSSALYLI